MTSYPYLGIEGYQPVWQRGLPSIKATHGRRLVDLLGRRLTRAWLLWDREADEWFADAPVLLDLDGEQLEIQHQKLDDLSLTWDTTDAHAPVSFLEFDLCWRDDAVPELAALAGGLVQSVALLEWRGRDMADGMVAVRLLLDDGEVTVYNALDENGLSFDPPQDAYAVHRLA